MAALGPATVTWGEGEGCAAAGPASTPAASNASSATYPWIACRPNGVTALEQLNFRRVAEAQRSLRNDGMSISSSRISSDERWSSSIVTSRFGRVRRVVSRAVL